MLPLRPNKRLGQKGLASIEALPLLFVFIMLMGYGLGMWGYIHSAILYSISARTYAFETFRHRANLEVFREQGSAFSSGVLHYGKFEIRYHAINDPTQVAQSTGSGIEFTASERPISIGRAPKSIQAKGETHRESVYDIKPRNMNVEVSPAWLMIGYGMCINASCGSR